MVDFNRNPEGKGGFRQGQSGNPKGMPKGTKHRLRAIPVEPEVVEERALVLVSVQQLARMSTPQAIQALVEALQDRSYRVAAAIALLDRGWGRPAQAVDLNIRKTVREMSDDELLAIASQPLPALPDVSPGLPNEDVSGEKPNDINES